MMLPLLLLTISGALCSLARADPDYEHSVGKRSSVCYGDLGCFSNSPPFWSLQRPISFLPQSPQQINPSFTLHTKEQQSPGHQLHADNLLALKTSTFNASRPTKILVHGFIETHQMAVWMEGSMNEFLRTGDYNVIIVDWKFGAFQLYGQASANTRVVGAMIAQLIKFLKNSTGASLEDMHIIGHSLGAHVAGYAGASLSHIGRITGLDPAGPFFQGTDKVVRLDPSDALFVDVIHTDGSDILSLDDGDLGLGIRQPCGHVDFFVNGGYHQPGCNRSLISHVDETGVVEGIRETVGCNHARAYLVFQESINSVCPFQAYRCDSENDFNKGHCLQCIGDSCDFMGMHADSVKPSGPAATNNYYLKTGGLSPFCHYHYRLDLTFSSSGAARSERGTMFATVVGSNSRIQETVLTPHVVEINPGNTYSYLLTSPSDLGEIQNVTFRWIKSIALFDIESWDLLGLRHPKLYIDRVRVFSGEEQALKTLCGHDAEVETGHSLLINGSC